MRQQLRALQARRFWIAGAARSGLGAMQLLKGAGARVFVTDKGNISPAARAVLEREGVPFEEGGHSLERMADGCDALVLSPGVPLSSPLCMAARRAGIPILSEIEVAGWFLDTHDRVIGITGTNGKSTTTHYTAQLFERGGIAAVACGNIGLSLSEALLKRRHEGAISSPGAPFAYVVELSSYQLETTFTLQFDAVAVLNLQDDHQARYGNMEEYLKAKWRLVGLCRTDGAVVLDAGVLDRAVRLGLPMPASRLWVTAHTPQPRPPQRPPLFPGLGVNTGALPLPFYGVLAPQGALFAPELSHASEGRVEAWQGGLKVCLGEDWQDFTVQEPCLPGLHNGLNILAASLLGLSCGVGHGVVRLQWEKAATLYRHLPHRLEELFPAGSALKDASGVQRRVRVFNDSKATNVESTLVALRAFATPVRLLLGGEAKGDSYLPIAAFRKFPLVRIYPFGAAAHRIRQELEGVEDLLAPPAAKMLEAAERALAESRDGDTLLLSPACASFDEFRNFEHRGEVFREWAESRRSDAAKNSTP